MADTEKAILAKLGKLLETYRAHQAKGYELIEEMTKLLGGGPGIAALMKRLEGAFATAWSTRYPGRYVWAYVKDRPQEKRLLGHLDIADLEGRIVSYLRDNDDYLVKQRHPFGLFVSQVNRYAPEAPGELALDAPPPTDCKHTPRCHSDQEHTRRRSEDLRR